MSLGARCNICRPASLTHVVMELGVRYALSVD